MLYIVFDRTLSFLIQRLNKSTHLKSDDLLMVRNEIIYKCVFKNGFLSLTKWMSPWNYFSLFCICVIYIFTIAAKLVVLFLITKKMCGQESNYPQGLNALFIYVCVFLKIDANMKLLLIYSEVQSWFFTVASNQKLEVNMLCLLVLHKSKDEKSINLSTVHKYCIL